MMRYYLRKLDRLTSYRSERSYLEHMAVNRTKPNGWIPVEVDEIVDPEMVSLSGITLTFGSDSGGSPIVAAAMSLWDGSGRATGEHHTGDIPSLIQLIRRNGAVTRKSGWGAMSNFASEQGYRDHAAREEAAIARLTSENPRLVVSDACEGIPGTNVYVEL